MVPRLDRAAGTVKDPSPVARVHGFEAVDGLIIPTILVPPILKELGVEAAEDGERAVGLNELRDTDAEEDAFGGVQPELGGREDMGEVLGERGDDRLVVAEDPHREL